MDGLERLAEGRQAEVFLRPDGRVLKLWREANRSPHVAIGARDEEHSP